MSIPVSDGDYRLSVDVILSEQGDAGLIVVFNESSTFYQLSLRPNGIYAIQRLEQDTVTNLEGWRRSAALERGANIVNRIRIEHHAGSFRFFANDQELTEFTPPVRQFTNRFGFTLTSATKRGRASFDNLEGEIYSGS